MLLSESDWPMCLATEHPDNRAIKCEHLTKFVLAVLVTLQRVDNGSVTASVDNTWLRELMMGLLVETVGRGMDRYVPWALSHSNACAYVRVFMHLSAERCVGFDFMQRSVEQCMP